MGCCGDREKGKTVAEDQKWDYIVRAKRVGILSKILTSTEPVRFQVHLLFSTLLLRLVVDPRTRLLRHLCCRCFHCRQSPRLQQLDQHRQA